MLFFAVFCSSPCSSLKRMGRKASKQTFGVSLFLSLVSIYIYIQMENPRRASVRAKTRTTAPIRLADRNLAHYPSRHCTVFKKKTAQWQTSSTHDSIHTGVIGRCLHVHLTHQIHGVADLSPCSRRATSQTVEVPNPWCEVQLLFGAAPWPIHQWKAPD